ncbi:MAG: helix-turn-helix transcriptional regulator [Gammaproteobacteria bacterium]|nr:helix-turn-helix transcriptional regulator [Gammaproteobacteria bacterium]
MEIQLALRWQIGSNPVEELPADLVRLLDGVERGGNLQFAARETRISYRHAWGLVKHWEQRFGCGLVTLERGRGSNLTPAGELLRAAWHKTQDRTAVMLAEAAAQAARQLEAMAHEPGVASLVLAASHGFGLTTLVTLLRASKVMPELQIVGSEEALKRYAAAQAQVAGFHLPQGPHGKKLWARFQRYLDARRDMLLLVETRELGFMAKRGTPRLAVEDIAAKQLRFLNRQAGSGSRLVFDLLLADAGIKPARIAGYHNEEYTHNAVAAVIAGGAADVGFGARTAAEQFGLTFWPEVTEKYLLAVAREALPRKPFSALPRLLAGAAYKRLLAGIPGSDSRAAGKAIELKQVAALINANLPRTQ